MGKPGKASSRDEYVVGLDVSTEAVRCLVARVSTGRPTVRGWASQPRPGLSKGQVLDVGRLASAIRACVEEAAAAAQVQVLSVIISAATEGAKGLNSRGSVPVDPSIGRVSESDRWRALQAASRISLPAGREILHSFPQGFTVAAIGAVDDPTHIPARRLQASVHILTGRRDALDSVRRAASQAEYLVEKIVADPVSCGASALAEEEKNRGCLLVNSGAGTTSLAVFRKGYPLYSRSFAIGSDHVANDLAIGLGISFDEAERTRISAAAAIEAALEEWTEELNPLSLDELLSVKAPATRKIGVICGLRLMEIIKMCKAELQTGGVLGVPRNIVLTGALASTPGLAASFQGLFGIPARVGSSPTVDGPKEILNDPALCACAGLLSLAPLYRCKEPGFDLVSCGDEAGLGGKIARWIADLF